MGITNWVAVATVAAGLASVGTLLLVAWQLRALSRQTREQARQTQATAAAIRASVYLGTMQSMVSIDQFLAGRPRLRADLYGRRPGSWGNRRRQQSDAGAEMLFDLFKMVLTNAEYHEMDEVEGWRNYMTSLMRGSPTLQDFWRRNRNWYSRSMQETLDDWKTCSDARPKTMRNERPPRPRTNSQASRTAGRRLRRPTLVHWAVNSRHSSTRADTRTIGG
jgi:hypothetical protein